VSSCRLDKTSTASSGRKYCPYSDASAGLHHAALEPAQLVGQHLRLFGVELAIRLGALDAAAKCIHHRMRDDLRAGAEAELGQCEVAFKRFSRQSLHAWLILRGFFEDI